MQALASAGNISGSTKGSRDNTTWVPLAQFPELTPFLFPPALLAQHAKDRG
jgi:hypothetical protein